MAGLPDDEKTIRAALIAMGVGPVGTTQPAPPPPPQPPAPPAPPQAPRPTPPIPPKPPTAPAAGTPKKPKTKPTAKPKKPQAAKPKKAKTRTKKWNRPQRHNPTAPRTAWDTRPPTPRQSLLEAWAAVPCRLKWLAYHASAAYLGWMVGLVDWVTYVTAWIAHTSLIGPQAIFWYAAAAAAFLLHHATRRRWLPVAWLAAVPASSVVVGVLLYGTPHP